MGHIFSLSPDANFIEYLALYLIQLTHNDPLHLGNTVLYLPSRRACLKLTQALRDPKLSGDTSFALPKMYGLNDLETIVFDHGLDFIDDNIPHKSKPWPVISPLQQIHLIARLIKQAKSETTLKQAIDLSKSLLSLLNELHRDEISKEQLKNTINTSLSTHYNDNLTLLMLVMEHYPIILREWGMIDPLSYKKMVYQRLPSFWQKYTQKHFIVAGITQYQKDSMYLLHQAKKLPNTTVIIPFISKTIIDAVHNDISPPPLSPYFHTFKILKDLKTTTPPLPVKSNFCHEDDRHSKQGQNFPFTKRESRKTIIEQTDTSPLEQAYSLKDRILTAIKNGHHDITIALPKRALATRLKAELAISGFYANDSSALTLDQTELGSLLMRVAKVIASQNIEDYIQLLKHSFVFKEPFFGEKIGTHTDRDDAQENKLENKEGTLHSFIPKSREQHLDYLYAYEVKLRSSPLISCSLNDHEYPYKNAIPSLSKGSYLERLQALFYFFTSTSLKKINSKKMDNFDNCENVADIHDIHELIEKLFHDIEQVSHFYDSLNEIEYFELVQHALQSLSVAQPAYISDSVHINIIGLMEARVERCDVMIITGLEEGTLPRSLDFDPWLSPSLRCALQLPLPDELEGLQAQDFFIALSSAPHIILSRCTEDDGLPLLASRFWHQVDFTQDNILNITRNTSMDISHQIHPLKIDSSVFLEKKPVKNNNHDVSIQMHAPSPSLPSIQEGYLQPPCPRRSLKPKKLSISAIKLLMEDSYGFYAKYILQLKRLYRFDDDVGALVFGQILHKALDAYIKEGHTFVPENTPMLHHFILLYFKKVPLTFMQKERLMGFCTWLCRNTLSLSIKTEVTLMRDVLIDEDIFSIYGTADRLDHLPDSASHNSKNHEMSEIQCNDITLVDYKTGTPPSQKDIKAGFSPQLPLEGWLLGYSPEKIMLLYIHVLGKAPFAETTTVKDPAALINDAEIGIENILSLYNQDDFVFYPTPNPDNQPSHSDYAYLERQNT